MQKKLFDKLVQECTESNDEVEIASENEHENKCSSCTLYIVLFPIFLQSVLELAFILLTFIST